ncbi:MAG: PhnD/SsuA/transferrin family substrate-binding protein [Rhodospirillales bacterium]|nr:PhnD/SsuA/transferrin family substrate-binding protein [Rhodospirillales bacterium]
MSLLPISMTFWDYDRVQALADGRVKIEGCDAVHFNLDLHDIFFRAIRSQDFDITEMSFSSYMMMKARGNAPYTAIPVFLSRMFRHSAIFIRTDRGINKPEDLKGKLVGVPEYQVTAALVARGMLSDEYGVKPSDISWRTGGVEDPGRPEKVDLNLPADVEVKAIPTDQSLSAMLAAGELDAILAPLPPSCFTKGAPNVGRLFPDYHAVEKAYWQKTKYFPIMHVCAIRTTLVEQHPWLAGNVFNAFSEAKDIAIKRLPNFGAAKATLPWLAAEVEETVALMGEDYWPYGVENNRIALENATRYSYEQGLSDRKLDIEELFAPSTLEQWKS